MPPPRRAAFALRVAAPGLLLALAACSPSAAPADCFVAVVPKGTTSDFWRAVHAGAEKAAHELRGPGGAAIKITWKGPARDDDREGQVKVVEDFVTRRFAAIVLAPLDDQALVSPCIDAHDAGIPVVVIDSGLAWDGKTSFVATDPRRGGALGAQRLGELLGGEGKALLVRSEAGNATAEREAGFRATMKEQFPAIELLATDPNGGAIEAQLGRFPQLDGICALDEATTFASLRALEGAGRAGTTKLVGFDASAALVAGLEAGKVQGLVVQRPFEMGELGVKAAIDALLGQPVAPRIDPGCLVATPENLATPEVSAALHPDLARWLR